LLGAILEFMDAFRMLRSSTVPQLGKGCLGRPGTARAGSSDARGLASTGCWSTGEVQGGRV